MRLGWLALISVLGAPQTNAPFPDFRALDVAGQKQSTTRWRGSTTLIVAITDRGAGDAMRGWFEAAGKRAPGARLGGIISISVPFFVSDEYARQKAREQIPKAYWHDNFFDAHHTISSFLGLPESRVPWAFVLDPQGRVLAQAHAAWSASESKAVWAALSR